MKILKINNSQTNAFESIKLSMINNKEISICSGWDACNCTGNDNCH